MMATATPGFLILLLFFMLDPVIQRGITSEKLATTLASLILAVVVLIPLLTIYVMFGEDIVNAFKFFF